MRLNDALSIQSPIICGPMYPCSNPELIAAVSNAGGIGIVQPITLTYVHGYEFREGLRYIKSLTDRPIGFNALIEKSSRVYEKKMMHWIQIALEEGVRFFITSLGNPTAVVKLVHAYGGLVYHDATEAKWAKIAVKAEVDGLIAVNSQAGGHAGIYDQKELFRRLKPFGLPLICAGGIGDKEAYEKAMSLGYSGVQMGTRFIATTECDVSLAYKGAIVSSTQDDIVLSQNLTGVDVSIIRPKRDKEYKTTSNFLVRWALKQPILKRIIRVWMAVRSIAYLKKTRHSETPDVIWQAGKSVEGVHQIKSVAEVFESLR